MGTVVRFPIHATSPVRTTAAARDSKVTRHRFNFDSLTIAGHRRAGIPRSFHEETVERGKPRFAATTLVPPSSSMRSSADCMGSNIFRNMRTSQGFAIRETTFFCFCVGVALMADDLESIGRRLTATREALGFSSQTDFCKELNIARSTWNPFETGERRITLEVALSLRKQFNISMDWIYFGDRTALPTHILRKLDRNAA